MKRWEDLLCGGMGIADRGGGGDDTYQKLSVATWNLTCI